MAINYSRMGSKTAARFTVVIAAIATIALLVVILAIPEDVNIPNATFLAAQLVAVYATADRLQGDRVRNHAARRGAVASAWPSVGIGLLCLPLVLGALFGVAILFEPSHGTVVEFGNDEIYYSGDATEDDARRLAGVLQDIEFFGESGASVRLESAFGQYTVSFVLVENAWEDAETVEGFREIGRSLADSAFSPPLKIELCDEYFTTKESLTIRGVKSEAMPLTTQVLSFGDYKVSLLTIGLLEHKFTLEPAPDDSEAVLSMCYTHRSETMEQVLCWTAAGKESTFDLEGGFQGILWETEREENLSEAIEYAASPRKVSGLDGIEASAGYQGIGPPRPTHEN